MFLDVGNLTTVEISKKKNTADNIIFERHVGIFEIVHLISL